MMDLQHLEKKYEKITNEPEWLDLHVKRSEKEIDENEFKNELLRLGMEDADVEIYLGILNDFDKNLTNLMVGSRINEISEIAFKYENFGENEERLIELTKLDKTDEVRQILEKELKMTKEDLDIVLEYLEWSANLEEDFESED